MAYPSKHSGRLLLLFVWTLTIRIHIETIGIPSEEIVGQHGGEIWTESKVNRETKFTVELPISTVTVIGEAA